MYICVLLTSSITSLVAFCYTVVCILCIVAIAPTELAPPRPRPPWGFKDRKMRLDALTNHPFAVGLAIRLVVAVALPLLLDDGLLLKGVRYTDIDYDVFTDAANHVAAGRSPYDRHTYRYTPFLAALLAQPGKWSEHAPLVSQLGPLIWWLDTKYFGRILFCIADALCGLIIVSLRRERRKKRSSDVGSKNTITDTPTTNVLKICQSPYFIDCIWWMYNPLAINICTRGSAESLVVILPVLLTVSILTSGKYRFGRFGVSGQSICAGIIHGVSIHSKLYPIIYTISFMANLSLQAQEAKKSRAQAFSALNLAHGVKRACWDEVLLPKKCGSSSFPWTEPTRLFVLVRLWISRIFFTTSSILFLVTSLGTFAFLTCLAVAQYGQEAFDEGFLYHFSRVDHRHNYSMHWYWIYLAQGRIAAASSSTSTMAIMGRMLLLPQAILLLYASLGIAPYDLPLALFVQSFLFVAQNKVITAQYFTWYLCLLPLCSGGVQWNSRGVKHSLGYVGASVVMWLGSAYCLEMQGFNVHLVVWLASLNFYLANIILLGRILNSYGDRGHRAKIE